MTILLLLVHFGSASLSLALCREDHGPPQETRLPDLLDLLSGGTSFSTAVSVWPRLRLAMEPSMCPCQCASSTHVCLCRDLAFQVRRLSACASVYCEEVQMVLWHRFLLTDPGFYQLSLVGLSFNLKFKIRWIIYHHLYYCSEIVELKLVFSWHKGNCVNKF